MLASEGGVTLKRCTCGVYALTVGPVTLRLAETEIHDLARDADQHTDCRCGKAHLAAGDATLHLDPRGRKTLRGVLGAALARSDAPGGFESPAGPTILH